nr:DNA-directed DNA polymerase II small subunit [Candidatus Sigynarchaeum springense]
MTIEEPLDKVIIMDFLRAGFNITPGALSFIKQRDNPSQFAQLLLKSFKSTRQRQTITREMLESIDSAVTKLVGSLAKRKATTSDAIAGRAADSLTTGEAAAKGNTVQIMTPSLARGKPVIEARASTLETPAGNEPVEAQVPIDLVSVDEVALPVKCELSPARDLTSKSTFTPLAKEHAARVKVIEDCTGKLRNDGEFNDFLHVFSDRFEKIKNIFKNRSDIPRIVDIEDIAEASRAGEEFYIIGMVINKRQTKSGNLMLEIDDNTGSTNVVISTKTKDPRILATIVLDEVLCFKGFNKEGFFFANEFFWPDVKRNRRPQLASEDLSIALISDIHVGSDNHLGELWDKFKRWMQGEGLSEKAREFAGKVKYIAIAGDLVDGVGVYPTQEDHLVIKDVYQQFDRVAEMLRDLPDYITFIVSPGSHEPVRKALPQPAIPRSYARGLYDLKAVMVGDPAVVETHGIKTMLFHGESFIDLSIDIPGISNSEPEKAMEKLMMSRHLAPSFGKKTELAPDKKDWLVINEVPDILHTGHVHCNGVRQYHGSWLVNSGCFQGQTDFMKGLGIEPSPGRPNIISLKTFKLTTLNLSR